MVTSPLNVPPAVACHPPAGVPHDDSTAERSRRDLHHLLARPEQVMTRDDLLRDVWGQSFSGSNVVDAVVKSLRRKLGPHVRAIATATGHGYRFAGFATG